MLNRLTAGATTKAALSSLQETTFASPPTTWCFVLRDLVALHFKVIGISSKHPISPTHVCARQIELLRYLL
jgi:hypothetical protein